jgi:cell division protease FtsH
MSDKVGRVAVSEPSGGGPFMGMQMLRRPPQWGSKIMGTVEQEVERLVNNSYLIAKQILSENRDLLEHVKTTLMDQEVVSAEEFQMMLVEYKARTIDYAIVGEERNREKLPFQQLPSSV